MLFPQTPDKDLKSPFFPENMKEKKCSLKSSIACLFSLNVQYDIYMYQINIASGKCIHDDNFDDSGSNAIK